MNTRGKCFRIRTKLQAENNNRAGNKPRGGGGYRNKKKCDTHVGTQEIKLWLPRKVTLFHIVHLGEQKLDRGDKTLTRRCLAAAFRRKAGGWRMAAFTSLPVSDSASAELRLAGWGLGGAHVTGWVSPLGLRLKSTGGVNCSDATRGEHVAALTHRCVFERCPRWHGGWWDERLCSFCRRVEPRWQYLQRWRLQEM